MAYKHGVYNTEQATSLTVPIQGSAGLQVIFGTAPIHLADPAAAIVVALLILRVAWQLMKMGMDELLEKSLPREQEEHILTLIAADPAVASPHNLRTRRIGQNIAVEVHIRVDGAMTVTESHRLTVDIERRLRDAYGEGTIVSIHVEPRKQPPVNESK